MDNDNLADVFFEELHKEDSYPGMVLARFYGELFNQTIGKDEFILFNRLLKLFNRDLVFLALVDMYGIDNLVFDNIRPLIYYLCKKRFEAKQSSTADMVAMISLDAGIKDINKRLEKKRKVVTVRSPFDE